METQVRRAMTLGHGRNVRPSWLSGAVLRLDQRLRRRIGVFEYSQNEDCLFRIRIGPAPAPMRLADGVTVEAGDPIVDLHIWNEHIEPIVKMSGSLGWASRVRRSVVLSLEELSAFLDDERDLAGVRAICGNMGLGGSDRTDQLLRLCRTAGFERVPLLRDISPGEHMHRVGENMLGLLLTMAVNPKSARPSILARDRALVAMSRDELRRRYGGPAPRDRH
jgi:YkoP domain